MLSIQHNLSAMNTNRQLGINHRKGMTLSEQLSSGYRINRASDDAAGLAISEKMRRKIRGLTQASDNIKDGIGYVQTADGALHEVQDMLQRINELSVQALNGTNTAGDRAAIDLEIQQLKNEVDRIFRETSFNERKIWSAPGNNPIQIGSTKEAAVTFPSVSTRSQITNVNRMAVPRTSYSFAADANGIVVSWTGYNGVPYASNTIPWDSYLAGSHSFSLKDHLDLTAYPELTGLDLKYTYNVHDLATFDDMVNSINGQTVSSSIYTSEYVQKLGNSSRVSFSTSFSYPSLLVSDKDFDTADDAFIEGINSNANITVNPTDAGNSAKPWEFTFNMDNIGKVTATAYSTTYYGSTAEPENGKWWRWISYQGGRYKSTIMHSPSPSNGSLDSITNALSTTNGYSLQNDALYGGTVRVNLSLKAETPFTCPDGTTTSSIGSITMTINVGSNDDPASITADLQKLTGIDIYDDASPSTTEAYRSGHNGSVQVDVPEYKYSYRLDIQAGAESGEIIPIIYDGLNTQVLGIRDLDVKTEAHAAAMLEQIQNALAIVSDQRSLFGAYQNRFEHAVQVNDNTAENLQAAESQIRDLDMADGMVAHSLNQILLQAGEAMLAQSNQASQPILELLRSDNP